eukprot:10143_1
MSSEDLNSFNTTNDISLSSQPKSKKSSNKKLKQNNILGKIYKIQSENKKLKKENGSLRNDKNQLEKQNQYLINVINKMITVVNNDSTNETEINLLPLNKSNNNNNTNTINIDINESNSNNKMTTNDNEHDTNENTNSGKSQSDNEIQQNSHNNAINKNNVQLVGKKRYLEDNNISPGNGDRVEESQPKHKRQRLQPMNKCQLLNSKPVIICSKLNADQIDVFNHFKEIFRDVAIFRTTFNHDVTHII